MVGKRTTAWCLLTTAMVRVFKPWFNTYSMRIKMHSIIHLKQYAGWCFVETQTTAWESIFGSFHAIYFRRRGKFFALTYCIHFP